MVKHGHKKKKLRNALFIYIIKTSEEKTERNLNEGTSGLKAISRKRKKRENKGASHETLKNIRVSDREALFRYMITQT